MALKVSNTHMVVLFRRHFEKVISSLPQIWKRFFTREIIYSTHITFISSYNNMFYLGLIKCTNTYNRENLFLPIFDGN